MTITQRGSKKVISDDALPTLEDASDDYFSGNEAFSGGDNTSIETARELEEPEFVKIRPRRSKDLTAARKEKLEIFLTRDLLPEKGEYLHILSNGNFDYFLFIPVLINLCGTADELYGSTWTMNRPNIQSLFDMFDAKKILKMSVVTGLDFKRRRIADASLLTLGMKDRGQRYRAFKNHAKVICLRIGERHFVMEGSANWTANPRMEQSLLADSKELYDFHRAWIEGYLVSE